MDQYTTLKTQCCECVKFINTKENKQLMKKAAVIIGYPVFIVWLSTSLVRYGFKVLHEAGIPEGILLQFAGAMLIILGILVVIDARKTYGRMVRNVCSKQEEAEI